MGWNFCVNYLFYSRKSYSTSSGTALDLDAAFLALLDLPHRENLSLLGLSFHLSSEVIFEQTSAVEADLSVPLFSRPVPGYAAVVLVTLFPNLQSLLLSIYSSNFIILSIHLCYTLGHLNKIFLRNIAGNIQ